MTSEAPYRSFPQDYLSAPDRAERAVLDFWVNDTVFKKQQIERKGAKPFVFFEGPPTANGKPGIHHVFARAIKDTICRYQWMMGFRVDRKAGWDTHGLPVELEVEKKLGISGKKQIEEIGVEHFNKLCEQSVFEYLKDWRSLSERMGYWLDYDHPYITFEQEYMESVWWLISRFHANGLLEKRFKVIPYCPRCGTGLSSHEVGQGYKDVQDPSVTVRFPIVNESGTSLLVWTTTPWTLPSNAGAAVHPDLEYVKVKSPKHPGELFWIVKSRAEAVVPGAEIVETKKGRELAGIKYTPPFWHAASMDVNLALIEKWMLKEGVKGNAFRVYSADFVTSTDGTGIVHIAPAYGADDYDLAERESLPIYSLVGRNGKFQEPLLAGVSRPKIVNRDTFFKDADAGLIAYLKEENRLFARATIQHSYPFCWRCDTALLYYAAPSWFLKTTAYRDEMVAKNREIRWAPPEIGAGRFGEWLEGNIDWAISRERYWGTPLPVWECEHCNHFEVIDSVEMLKKRAKAETPVGINLHKPAIDNITIECSNCKKDAKRSTSVIDCWFDSGAMPFAQHHYPFSEESRKLVNDQFPANFIAEGLDQTRGWFYTLHAIATFLTCYDKDRKYKDHPLPLPETSAYKACVVNGLVLDAQGRKMSKRLGNAVEPFKAMAEHGADAVRLLLLGSGALHLNRRFDPDSMTALRRQVIIPLVNCLQFFATYANEANYQYYEIAPERAKSRTLLDRWIRSRAKSLAKKVGESLEQFDIPAAVAAIANFAEAECSNWYVRRNRKRFQTGAADDRLAGLETLRYVLGVAARCLAPIAPFAAEMLWHRLYRRDAECQSVHLQLFPTLDANFNEEFDPALENAMGSALSVARLARAVREKHKIRNTIPLPSIDLLVPRMAAGAGSFMSAVEEIVKDEVNVDAVHWEFYPPEPGQPHYFNLKAKPNFPVLGKRAGKLMKSIQQAVEKLTDTELKEFMLNGQRMVALDGGAFELSLEDVLISAEVQDSACESDGRITVGLNVKFNETAGNRAIARELASAVNQARRDANFKLSDRCRVEIAADPAAARLIAGIEAGGGRQRWLEDLRASSIQEIERANATDWLEVESVDALKIAFRVVRENAG